MTPLENPLRRLFGLDRGTPIGALPVITPVGTRLDPYLMVNRRDFATLVRWSIDETLNQYHQGETVARITLIRAPEEYRRPWRIGGVQ